MTTAAIWAVPPLPARLKIRFRVMKAALKAPNRLGMIFMKRVLEGVPEEPLTPPPGIVTVNIDRSTGQLANGGNSRAEYFIEGHAAYPSGGARSWHHHYR